MIAQAFQPYMGALFFNDNNFSEIAAIMRFAFELTIQSKNANDYISYIKEILERY